MKKFLALSLSSLFLILGLATQAKAQSEQDYKDLAKYSAGMDVITTQILANASLREFNDQLSKKYDLNLSANHSNCFSEDFIQIFSAEDKLKTKEIKKAVRSICSLKVIKFSNQVRNCETNCKKQRELYNQLLK